MSIEDTLKAGITLLVCTFNRAEELEDLLHTATNQKVTDPSNFEIVVVDNNSTDQTKEVVEKYSSCNSTKITYIFEPTQGKSHALNSGLEFVCTPYYAIVDDDFLLPDDWVEKILNSFELYPEASFVSGRVLPVWQADPPGWLTKQHYAAIAMADYGDEAFLTDADNQICLLACSFRTEDVKKIGGYRPDLGVTSGQTGGIEDLDLLQRLWKGGCKGVYVPEIWCHHKVTPNRCTKKYHRSWHTGHGAFYATMRNPEFEKSRSRFLDVPLHLYGQAIEDSKQILKYLLSGKRDLAFAPETNLRFFLGFWKRRSIDAWRAGSFNPVREAITLFRSLMDHKRPDP